MNTWIQALKIWNKQNPTWCVPRKDTTEYNEVIKIKLKLENQMKKGQEPKQKLMSSQPEPKPEPIKRIIQIKKKSNNKKIKVSYFYNPFIRTKIYLIDEDNNVYSLKSKKKIGKLDREKYTIYDLKGNIKEKTDYDLENDRQLDQLTEDIFESANIYDDDANEGYWLKDGIVFDLWSGRAVGKWDNKNKRIIRKKQD